MICLWSIGAGSSSQGEGLSAKSGNLIFTVFATAPLLPAVVVRQPVAADYQVYDNELKVRLWDDWKTTELVCGAFTLA